MRTLVATALVAYAKADETSLMQERLQSSHKLAAGESSRQDSTSKLLETAVNMIKNGVTPDVITFVDATNADINDQVLIAIQSEHDTDQAYINELCTNFLNAVEKLEDEAAAIDVHSTNSLDSQSAHHSCRAEEAYACAKSRRCEEQLRQKWNVVKREESLMREIHGHIHDEWCIHPPVFADIDDWLSNPFNWAQTSPYPILEVQADVKTFRHESLILFDRYTEQKVIVERAWTDYNEKLEECATLEGEWEDKVPDCDAKQATARGHACQHATATRAARAEFGAEWARLNEQFTEAQRVKTANAQDRQNEWETLKIVQCLLDHVHSSVITSIETGGPCPTIDSDPEGVTLAIEDCHIVERGCENPDSMTAHLCLDWCEIPEVPPLPPVEEPACTPAFVAMEQSAFLAGIQTTYSERLSSNADYPGDELTAYETILSEAGWAGCAPPLVCVDCAGHETAEPNTNDNNPSHTCRLHEEYLSPGQSNADTFRCLDGQCISQSGRCNGHNNCADYSDEEGCDADSWLPVSYLTTSFTCPSDQHSDVHFECGNGRCIHKVGMCNGVDNCGDGTDENSCLGSLDVTVEPTSGRTITVETLQMSSGVFHDREYSFDSLGHFAGKTFIKYSNDDKHTDQNKVMIKLRTKEPLTVYIAKLAGHSLHWLAGEGYEHSAYPGVSFSGIRDTRHKEWDPELLTTDDFAAEQVWSKTFEAGTISIPGNGGGDGSFVVLVDRPGPLCNTNLMVQGCDNNERNLEPVCNSAAVRCCDMSGSTCNSGSFPQTATFLDGTSSVGTACEAGECNGQPNTWCHAEVTHQHAQEICEGAGQRLCTRAEIEEDNVCCGNGCGHNGRLIWIAA